MRFLTQLFILCEIGSLFSPNQIVAGVAATSRGLSDLTLSILTDNDLYGNDSSRTSRAILVESTHSRSGAPNACGLLGEALWSPTLNGPFNAGLNNSLSYQAFLKYSDSQLFWVNLPGCIALDIKGKTRSADCHKRLPVLCTNSAPLASKSSKDNSAQWHVTRTLGQPNQVVTGYRDRVSFRFLGVRFAPEPQRFAHSTVYEYNGPQQISALDYPNVCLQNINNMGIIFGVEDCLFVNIWTPYLPGKSSNTNNLKPVLVWIHGGGLQFGSSNEPVYDGASYASRGDVVLVGVHYRLGNFGWLGVNPQPTRDGEGNGNYGLGDMITALKWIKKNIKYFGGDGSNVTIMGSSGGAIAVRALLASKKTKGLISGGIIQSGAWTFSPGKAGAEYLTVAESLEYNGNDIISSLNCSGLNNAKTLQCLRAVDSDTIARSPSLSYPLVDKVLLNGDLGVTGQGTAVSVPILIGVARDELAPWNSGLYGATDPDDFLTTVAPALFDGDLSYLSDSPAFPPPPNAPTPAEAAFNVSTRIMTDYGFTCLTWATAYSLEKHNVMPAVYAYTFNRTIQPLEWSPPMCNPPVTPEKPLGDLDGEYYKCHGAEVLITFGTATFNEMQPRDAYDVPFTQYIVDLWTSFARTGNPNPDLQFLKARGYVHTLDRVAKTGAWEKLDRKKNKWTARTFQWNSHQEPLSERQQCAAMGLPLDYYEN